MKHNKYAAALIDYRLLDDDDQHDQSGLHLALYLGENYFIPRIILTKFDSSEYAVKSLKPDHRGRVAGLDFIIKQQGLESMLEAIEKIIMKEKTFLCYAKPDREAVSTLYDILATLG